MDTLFAVARNLAPILVVTYQGKTFVLVSRHDDVREVMSLPNVFRVPYAPKLHVIMGGGNIFLGMHDEPDFTREGDHAGRGAAGGGPDQGEARSRAPGGRDRRPGRQAA
jgi:hypothetical protein